MFGSVCIFVYVGADHPLEVPGDSALRLMKLKRREHKKLLWGEHAYLLRPEQPAGLRSRGRRRPNQRVPVFDRGPISWPEPRS